jgi:hypothetical protein
MLQGEELRRRLNCIAVNALREALIAKGRGDMPWIDDDWRRCDMISQILDLHELDTVDRLNEHYPLVSSYQAPKNAALDELGEALAKALSGDEPTQITDGVTATVNTTRPKVGKSA